MKSKKKIIALSILLFVIGGCTAYYELYISKTLYIPYDRDIDTTINPDGVKSIIKDPQTGSKYEGTHNSKKAMDNDNDEIGVLKINSGTIANNLKEKKENATEKNGLGGIEISIDNEYNLNSLKVPYEKEENEKLAKTLTSEEIIEDKKSDFETLRKYDGEYIRIENYELDKLGQHKKDYTFLNSKLDDINVYLYMDCTDEITSNYKLNAGDKVTIEGKLTNMVINKGGHCMCIYGSGMIAMSKVTLKDRVALILNAHSKEDIMYTKYTTDSKGEIIHKNASYEPVNYYYNLTDKNTLMLTNCRIIKEN